MRSLRHKYVGYTNVKTLIILNHLYDAYAKITAQDLKENVKRLNTPYDPNKTIETLIDQVKNTINYFATGNSPRTSKQILNTVYNLIFETGVYDNDCRDWRKKTEPEKLRITLKLFYLG